MREDAASTTAAAEDSLENMLPMCEGEGSCGRRSVLSFNSALKQERSEWYESKY